MAETAATVQFADGKAYERFMGRWSRLAGEIFIDWLGLPVGLAPERVEQIKARLAEIIPRDGSSVRIQARAWAVRGRVPG